MVTQASGKMLSPPTPFGFCVMSAVDIPAPLIATIMLPTSVWSKQRKRDILIRGRKDLL
jgi:hypothetical protein